MRKLVFASLSAIVIGLAFAPGTMAAPASPAGISEAAAASSPFVTACGTAAAIRDGVAAGGAAIGGVVGEMPGWR